LLLQSFPKGGVVDNFAASSWQTDTATEDPVHPPTWFDTIIFLICLSERQLSGVDAIYTCYRSVDRVD